MSPSQLDEDWFKTTLKEIDLKDFKLLYVGRIRVKRDFSITKINQRQG